MKHVKTKEPAIPEHPLRLKLRKTLRGIDASISQVRTAIQVEKHDNMEWFLKIGQAEKLLSHPECKNKEAVQILLDKAISCFEDSDYLLAEYSTRYETLNKYRIEISEALDEIKNPSPETDELQHRLNILGSSYVEVSPKTLSAGDDEAMNRSLQETLFAVEALLALQKEDAS